MPTSFSNNVANAGHFYKKLNYFWNLLKNSVRILQYPEGIPETFRESIASGLGYMLITFISLLMSSFAECYYVLDLIATSMKRREEVDKFIKDLSSIQIDRTEKEQYILKESSPPRPLCLISWLLSNENDPEGKFKKIIYDIKNNTSPSQQRRLLEQFLDCEDVRNIITKIGLNTDLKIIQSYAQELRTGLKDFILNWDKLKEEWRLKIIKFIGQNGYWLSYIIKASVAILIIIGVSFVGIALSIISTVLVAGAVGINIGLIIYGYVSLYFGYGAKGEIMRNQALAELFQNKWNEIVAKNNEEQKSLLLNLDIKKDGIIPKWEQLSPQQRKYACNFLLKQLDPSAKRNALFKAFFNMGYGADLLACGSTFSSGVLWAFLCLAVGLGIVSSVIASPVSIVILTLATTFTLVSIGLFIYTERRKKEFNKIFETKAQEVKTEEPTPPTSLIETETNSAILTSSDSANATETANIPLLTSIEQEPSKTNTNSSSIASTITKFDSAGVFNNKKSTATLSSEELSTTTSLTSPTLPTEINSAILTSSDLANAAKTPESKSSPIPIKEYEPPTKTDPNSSATGKNKSATILAYGFFPTKNDPQETKTRKISTTSPTETSSANAELFGNKTDDLMTVPLLIKTST